MPQLRDTRGRVTVRIKLDKDGSLVATEIVRPSNIGGLDQNVVFATRQSSFPFPPRNANDADLTFLVTYIYR
jgi:TonB family protein